MLRSAGGRHGLSCLQAAPLTRPLRPATATYLSSPPHQPFPLSPSMFVLDETPRSRKRQRDTLESLPKDCPEDPPTAKRKHTSAAGTYRWHRPASFWDRLSKVHLSRGALREFDRRTSRGAQLGLTPRSSTLSRPTTKSVKRFSRHGGPDLNYIRGVSPVRVRYPSLTLTGVLL